MIWRGVLASRARQVRNRLRGRGRWQLLVGLALLAWFFALVWASLAAAFSHFGEMGWGSKLSGHLLAAALGGALVGVLVFDLQAAVSAVLLDSDLELLRRAPIAPLELVAIKALDSLPRTAALIVAMALPACLAFATALGLPAWGWALLPLLLAGLWATPLGLGLGAALLVLRVAPARRTREALAVLSTLVMLALWMLNSFAMPHLLGAEGTSVRGLLEALEPGPWVLAVSPPHWAASALEAAHRGAPLEAWGWGLRLAAAGGASLAVAALAARRLVAEIQARVAVGEVERTRRHPRRRGVPATGTRAMLLKDARLFTRDWAVLGDVVTAAILWTLLPLIAGPLHQAPPPLLARFMLVALAVGLGYEVGARTVPYEGAALAWSRLAPVSPWRWNLVKWTGGALLSLPMMLAAAAVVRVALPLGWWAWTEAVVAAFSALALALAFGLWTGWTFGDPAWTNPRAMLTLPGRLLASLLLVGQAGAWFVGLALADAFRGALPAGVVLWGPIALGALLSAPAMALAARAAARHEWSE